jgi:hypothetical protein
MITNRIMRLLRIRFLSLILALMVMVCQATSVGAQTTASHPGMASAPGDTLLQSEIKPGGGAHFVPNTLTCKLGQVFTISNDTNATQTVIFNGTPQITIAPTGDVTEKCKPKGRAVYGLESHPHAKLIVTVT